MILDEFEEAVGVSLKEIGNNIEELLGLIPETIYEDEYDNYLYSEIDC